jgi:hypothetical protein
MEGLLNHMMAMEAEARRVIATLPPLDGVRRASR